MARICFFDHFSGLSGAEINLLGLIKTIRAGNPDLLLVCPSHGLLAAEAGKLGVETKLFPLSGRIASKPRHMLNALSFLAYTLACLPVALKFSRFLRKERIGLLYTNSMKAHVIGALAAALAGIPVIWHVQDILPRGFARRLFVFEGKLFAAKIIAISEAVKEQFGASEKVSVVYNGVGLPKASLKEAGKRVRRELRIPEYAPVVTMLGRIAPWKGQHCFIEAARIALNKIPNAYFLVVGDAMFGEQEYKRQIICQAGGSKRIIATGFRKDAEAVIAASNVLVHCSIEPEPFGRVIIEAMSQGKPVIASCFGAPKEIVADGESGFIVDPKDTKKLAAKMVETAANKKLARKLGLKGRQIVRQKFDLRETAAEIGSLVSSIVH